MNFYDNVVQPFIKSGLIMETWGQGGLDEANCTASDYNQRIYSNLDIEFSSSDKFGYLEDHSKYGIGLLDNWVCTGDINRQTV